ncbi:MAG: hypothetical protein V3S46_08665 [Nitrospinota bacterium]
MRFSGKPAAIRFAASIFAVVFVSASCATGQKARMELPKTVVQPTKSEETFVPIPAPKPETTAAMPEEKPFTVKLKETGKEFIEEEQEDLFSLNFKEISLEAVINMLSENGRNFRYVIHPDVGERRVLGVVLEKVTWFEALEIILRLHNLVMVEEKGLIVVNTYENYLERLAREDEDIKRRQEKAKAEKEITADTIEAKKMVEEEDMGFRSFRLKYTRPDSVLSYFSNIYGGTTKEATGGGKGEKSTGLITESGISFSTFPQLSLISAFGTISQLDEIAMQLAVIDQPQKQVFIESRIVEISRSHSRSLGIQWGGSMAASMGSNVAPGYIISGGSLGGSGLDGAAIEFPATDASGSGNPVAAVSISLADAFGTSMLNARLSALETQGKSKTLANPKITTVNGSTAKIEKGWEIPYTKVVADRSTTEFKEALISLEVTPFITPNNMINMQIVATKDDPDATFTSAAGDLSIVTRHLETTVFVADGGTAVLGGVFENVQKDNQAGLPFFSDIPVLGWLFKSKSKTDDERELLIFITPTIVKGDFT